MSSRDGNFGKIDKRTRYILKFLRDAKGAGRAPFAGDREKSLLLSGAKGTTILVKTSELEGLIAADLVQVNTDRIVLSKAGTAWLARFSANDVVGDEPFRNQHAALVTSQIELDGAWQEVIRNDNESPLLRLRNRKAPDGTPWLDDAAFQAGERLRRDFTLGCLAQKVTASWDAAIGTAGKKSAAGGVADLADSAIDARSRVNAAMDRVGPELAGVLLDVCCFLKGFEMVERERRWPPRSAKFMLRAGLQILAGHYGTVARGKDRVPIRTWNGADNRPVVPA